MPETFNLFTISAKYKWFWNWNSMHKLSVKNESKKYLIVRHSRTQKLPPICLSEKLFEYVFQQSNL